MITLYSTQTSAAKAGLAWTKKAFKGESRICKIVPAILFAHGDKRVDGYVVHGETTHLHSSYGQTSERVEEVYV